MINTSGSTIRSTTLALSNARTDNEGRRLVDLNMYGKANGLSLKYRRRSRLLAMENDRAGIEFTMNIREMRQHLLMSHVAETCRSKLSEN